MTKIAKGASNADLFRTPSLFYSSAREGFGDFLANLDPDGTDRSGVLLPAFIGWSPHEGSGVFDPVSGSGLPYGFYEPNSDLTVHLERLEAKLAEGRWRVLVLIHYWGRTDPHLSDIRDLATRHGCILVEDLAHGFFSASRGAAGWAGCVNMFSLHKMLPFSEGGMITYRDQALIRGQRETRPGLARDVMNYDWRAISALRRRNFLELMSRLSAVPEFGIEFELLWPELSPHDVPQSFPVRVLNGKRDAIYAKLNAAGYGMTSLYHTLIHALAEGVPTMQALAASVTNFPVHQDADAAEQEGMVVAFCRALSD